MQREIGHDHEETIMAPTAGAVLINPKPQGPVWENILRKNGHKSGCSAKQDNEKIERNRP